LDEAFQLGYNAATARNDWEIRALRQRPEFREIIERRR
jgi:hypothetical protein